MATAVHVTLNAATLYAGAAGAQMGAAGQVLMPQYNQVVRMPALATTDTIIQL